MPGPRKLRRCAFRLQVYGVAVLMTGESGKPLPETAENRSSRFGSFRRLEPVWAAVLIVAILGGLLMIASEFALRGDGARRGLPAHRAGPLSAAFTESLRPRPAP